MKISQGMTVTFKSFGPRVPEHWFVGKVLAVYDPEGRCLIDDDPRREPRVVATARLRPLEISARSAPRGGATA